ncbi:MAG: ArsB/NhaD family transporter [Dehalococcoidia bacterium]|nr:ArsB/NhaD family transporter [Dehalococcoidia bacterium]
MPETVIAGIVFGATYVVIVSERVHKTAAALAGAVVMILVKIEGFDQSEAFQSIDFNVIFLLAGMMIIAAILSKTGVFQWLAIRTAKLGRGEPVRILVGLSLVTAVLSAFLDNVTTVVLIAPITIFLAGVLQVSAVPLLISEALASNIGGTATLIGDPPNILIGSAADLDFMAFVLNVMPVVLLILVVYVLLAPLLFGRKLTNHPETRARIMAMDERDTITDPRLLRLSIMVLGVTLVGFVLHGAFDYEPATVALLGAAVLLVFSRQDPQDVLREVEWSTLLFFIGLFIVVGGVDSVGLLSDFGEKMAEIAGGSQTAAAMLILWPSALFSSLVNQIPYTTAMIPVVRQMGMEMGQPGNVLWWALSLGACLGANLTMVAAAANVLVANLATKGGQPIRFWEFFRYGAAVTFASILISSVYIWLRYLM